MAEFCLDCLNRIEQTRYTPKDVVLSKEGDLCEGCAQCKRVVIAVRHGAHIGLLRFPRWSRFMKRL